LLEESFGDDTKRMTMIRLIADLKQCRI